MQLYVKALKYHLVPEEHGEVDNELPSWAAYRTPDVFYGLGREFATSGTFTATKSRRASCRTTSAYQETRIAADEARLTLGNISPPGAFLDRARLIGDPAYHPAHAVLALTRRMR
jgi:hypothetical protein